MIRLILLVFQISPKTLGNNIVVYHSKLTAVRCSSGTIAHDQFCSRNRLPLAAKWVFHRQISMNLAQVQRPTRCTDALLHTDPFVICDDRIFPTFSTPIDRNLFLSVCEIERDPTRTNLFYSQVFTQNIIYAGERNAQGCLYLTVCHMTILHYQFTHAIIVLWHNGWFWTTFMGLVFEWASHSGAFGRKAWQK